MSISVQLRTYLSPDPTSTLPCHQLTDVGLGEGKVRDCSYIIINPKKVWHTSQSSQVQEAEEQVWFSAV